MLEHKGTVTIETERLVLRRFTRDDATCVFNNWANDMDVCRYMRWTPHRDKEESRRILKGWLDSYRRVSFYQWAITLKNSNDPIGAIALFVVNESDLCGDIGYCIGRKYWGQGIATEALKALLNFAFTSVGFNRIEAYHSVNNPASGRVMQKAGMTFEGTAKQKYRSITGFEDSNMYSIIKEDFEGVKYEQFHNHKENRG